MNDPKKFMAPRWLEVGLVCEEFGIHPGVLGFDPDDPRVYRITRKVRDVFHAAVSRKEAKNKSEWDKKHPASHRLLLWAKKGVVEDQELPAGEVMVTVPDRPADWNKPKKPDG